MALNEQRAWLICYDIANPRRLGRIYRYINTVAVPVQYSLYVTENSAQEIRKIRDHLAKLIAPNEDDVRIYSLPARSNIVHYGRGALPDGLLLAQSEPARGVWSVAGANATGKPST